MDWTRLQDVIVICLPVFAMITMGAILRRRGVLNDEHRNFANFLTYNFSLPALIFVGVAKQRFTELLDVPLVLAPLLAILTITAIFAILAKIMNIRGTLAAAFVFGTFWANVSYMGFPLANNAYGAEGLGRAAIYNAFVMPAFVIAAFSIIGFYAGDGRSDFKQKITKAIINPIVVSAVLGILTALAAEPFRNTDGDFAINNTLQAGLQIIGAFLKMVGAMGLPLALLAVGGSMRISEIKQRPGLLALVLAGKLILLPLITMIILKLFFQNADPKSFTVAIMLSATPNAVASYVVSRQIGVEEGFVSSMLVLGTALSIITLPFWLYIAM